MIGYHVFEKLPWMDAFVNAAMILSGMGPVATLQTDAGKIFAGCYALFSGLALVAILGIIFAPVVHRFLHKFHLEDEGRVAKRKSDAGHFDNLKADPHPDLLPSMGEGTASSLIFTPIQPFAISFHEFCFFEISRAGQRLHRH